MEIQKDILSHELFPELSRRSQLKRIEIIEAAIQQIQEKGFESLTFESLAEAIGTNRSHVRYHYKELITILEDCMKFVTSVAQKMTVERILAANGWKEQIREIICTALSHYAAFPAHASVLMFFYARSSFDPVFRSLYLLIRQSGRDRIASILAPVLGSDSIARADAIEAAQSIQNLVFGHIFDRICSGLDAANVKFQQRVVDEAIEVILCKIRQQIQSEP